MGADMSYQWRVGEKIVCIFDGWVAKNGETVPQKGSVYTIENIEIYKPDGTIGFELVEIVNAPRQYDTGFGECNFAATGFRPLIKTNIEVFEKLLLKKPRKKSAPKQVERVE